MSDGVTVTEIAAVDLGPRMSQFRMFTLLGIRFWDAHTDLPVQSRLRVMAIPAGMQAPVEAVRSRSNAYVFPELPGLRRFELMEEEDILSPPGGRVSFVITVEDPAGQYLPAVFSLDLPLPYKGLFLSQTPGAHAQLFSAPARAVPAGMAAVRADLWDEDNGRPAAYGVLQVNIQGREKIGIADGAGRALVLMPWPGTDRLTVGSPPGMNQGSVHGQTWPVDVSAHFDGSGLRFPLADSATAPARLRTVPSLKTVLEQPAGRIHATLGDAGAANLAATLRYDQELILKTTFADPVRLSISRGNP